jgi:hypothetical protein
VIEKQILTRWALSIEKFVDECLFRGEKRKPSSQQRRVLQDIDAGMSDISIKSGHGCFGLGTKVMRFNGEICSVEDVVVGDKLMGDDGTSRDVLELYRGEETMYRFMLSDGMAYEFNESHILCLVATQTHGRQKAGSKITVTVREWLTWSDRKKRTHAFYRSDVDFSSGEELPIDPYTLGVWLGDGSSTSDYIWLGDAKREVLEAIKAEHKADEKNCKKYKLGIRSELKSLGLMQGKKFVPFVYKTSSRSDRLKLIAGMLDTDGSVDRYSYEWSTKHKSLAEDMEFLLKSVGCHATIKEKIVKGRVYYRMSIGRNIANIPTLRLKTPDHNRQRDNLHFGIKSVECLGVGNYYGFELDGNHKFLGADFSVLHNTGKTSLLSWVILWVGLFKYDAKIPCTAPTAPQLVRLLLPEVRKWREKLPRELKEAVIVKNDSVAFSTGNVAVARTARKEAPEGLQGFHATYLCWIIDEASGVPNTIFEVIEGSLTGEKHLRLLTANPTRTDGYFYDSQNKNRHLWKCHTFNAEESENVSRESIERKRAEYGEDSDAYRVRVLGHFPKTSSDAVIPMWLIEEAINREDAEINRYGAEVWGLDYADGGGDKTWLAKRNGNEFYAFEECTIQGSHKQSETALWLAMQYNLAKNKPKAIFVDAIGEGSGLVSRCRESDLSHLPVIPVKVSERAVRADIYFNKRAELYYNLKAVLQDGGKILDDGMLIGDLSAQRFVLSERGGLLQLVAKDKIKELLGRSPDKGDAAALCCAQVVVTPHEVEREMEERILHEEVSEYGSW